MLTEHHLVRIDPPTWTIDTSYAAVSLGQSPPATTQVAVRDDCTVVVMAATAEGTRFDVYTTDGAPSRSFTLALPWPRNALFDRDGRLVLDFDVPQPIDLRLARVNLSLGGLDPAFGDAGLADLEIPGVDSTPGSVRYARLVAVAPDGSLIAAVWTEEGQERTVEYARVLVDD
ncbi:MAG TPA: hypothetical protein VHE35_08700 [Kofleriaceae bacterium]|nr:hypothetical protein [Kofleriaceae bacterium]